MMTSNFILVVDDDADTLTMLTYVVKRLPNGYRVATAISGQEAVEYLSGDGPFADRVKYPFPQLVLLDLKMPLMDGFQVLRWIRRESAYPFLPVIVLTDSVFDGDTVRAYAEGANSFLIKGHDLHELTAQIESAIEHWTKFATVPTRPVVLRPPDLDALGDETRK
jgi:CheY-like chemotaxis protein